jgi:hypothetical protein
VEPCRTYPKDWIAICVSHVCKRRPKQSFISPEVHCPPEMRH